MTVTMTTAQRTRRDREAVVGERLVRARERRRARAEQAAGGAFRAVPARTDDQPLLSSAQRRLWFLSQLEPDSAAYVIPVVFRLEGPLDASRLRDAWQAVVRRHEVLRTRYEVVDGEPRPVVDEAPEGNWAVADSPSEIDVRHLVEQPFDLAVEQPWRVWLAELTSDEHLFIAVVHHIAADGWSVRVLLDDLSAAYAGTGPASSGLQYADFAHYRSTPDGAEGASLGYWIGHLHDAPTTLALPTDRPRPLVSSTAGETVTVRVGDATADAVRSVARATAATPFMVLLAGLHVVLGRWAGTDDLVVGTPVAGRARREWETLVGCFVNTLALRTRSRATDTVVELIDHVRDVTIDGLANQAIGFEDVVEAVVPQRDASSTPIYQVMLTAHTEPAPQLTLPGISATWVAEPVSVAKNDLSLHACGALLGGDADGEPELHLGATYRTSLFDRPTIERLLGHVEQVLVEFAADPGRELSTVHLLTDAEIEQLPDLIGATATPAIARARSIGALVRDVAARHPERIAVSSAGSDLTYTELLARTDHLAGVLQQAGVGRGDRVGLFVERSCDVVVGMLAVMGLGAAYVPIDPMYPDSRVDALVTGADVRAVISQPALAGRLAAEIPVVLVNAEPVGEPSGIDLAASDDVAYVLFTSGTTGAPKGVEVEHHHVLTYLDGLHRMVDMRDGWSWAMMTTPCADLGLTNLFGALTTGGRVHLMTYEQVTDPATVGHYFRQHRIDAMKLVPSQLAALWDEADPTAVLPAELLILAGEPCPWSLVDQIRAAAPGLAVHNHYGPTETTVSSMGLAVSAGGRIGNSPIVPLGRPFPGTRAHVLDAAGRPVPVGVPGELVLAGPTVSRGYLGLPEQTAARFVAEPPVPGIRRERAYRSGDLVRRLPTGEIEFLGRADDQVKIRGYRVEPGDIAHAARQHPAVTDCAVVVRDDHPGTRTLAAYLTPAAGEPEDLPLGEVRDHLRALLPDYMVPADLVAMAVLPVTANGKLDRAALPAPDPSLRAAVGGGELEGPTEEIVAAAWRTVLGLEPVGPNANFFDVGGDSFSAVRVVRALQGAVSVVDLFMHPTVRDLAAVIDTRRTEPSGEARLLRRLDTHRGRADVHFVCVPYGGGSPVTFAPLANAVGASVAVHGVDLPGHDPSRPAEDPRPLREVAAELVEEIRHLDGDVVLYGHCLGGALAVETALQLEEAGTRVLGVVTAGTLPAARLPGRFTRFVNRVLPTDRWLSDRAYHDMLRSLGGFTDVVDPADRAFLVRALRHDARQAETYYTERYDEPEAQRRRLRAPVLCVVGERDRATELYEERFAEWQDFSAEVDLAVIPSAGHYFLKHQADELAAILGEHVRTWRRGAPPRARSAVADAGAGSGAGAGAGAGEPSARTFLWVALTQLLSMIGTGLTTFALGVWVLQQTGSVTRFAMISVLAVLPAILLSPIAGAVADRYDRRRVMLVADAVAGLATAVLVGLVATGRLELWFVYVFACVGAAANAFQRPAYLAAISQLVPKRYLGQANGLVSLGTSAGDLVAALAGGVLVGLFGLGTVIAIDVATFGVAFVVLLLVRFPARLWIRQEETFRAEVAGGWRYIIRRRPLVVMVGFFVVFNFLFSLPLVLATPMLLAGNSPQTLGLVLAAGGIGALFGSLLMAVWGGTRRRAVGMVGGTITLGLGVVLLGATPVPFVQAVAMAGIYGSLLVLNAHWLSLIQTKVGLELQGRVLAVNQMVAMSTMPLGFLAAGPFSDWTNSATADGGPLAPLAAALDLGSGAHIAIAVLLIGVATTVWGVIGLATPTLRRMEDDLPDAVPDAIIAADRDELQAQADEALARHRQLLVSR